MKELQQHGTEIHTEAARPGAGSLVRALCQAVFLRSPHKMPEGFLG